MVSKYDSLGDFLRDSGRETVPMTFEEIERLVGTKLPKSRKHQAWWSNSTSNNVMTKVWLDAGYRSEQVDTVKRKLVFRRVAPSPKPARGMSEETRAYDSRNKKPSGHHPAFGAMKGTFTIETGYDLTSPICSDQEWAEIEKEMEADWDVIEQGFSRRKK